LKLVFAYTFAHRVIIDEEWREFSGTNAPRSEFSVQSSAFRDDLICRISVLCGSAV
jgi:hypothetical protein